MLIIVQSLNINFKYDSCQVLVNNNCWHKMQLYLWINLNQNNRSVLVCRYSVLWEKTGPILLLLVSLMVDRQTKYGWVFEVLKILYRLNCLGFYFLYFHCNVTTVLEQHFSQLLSSKAFKVRKIWLASSFCQSLLLGTSVSNNTMYV